MLAEIHFANSCTVPAACRSIFIGCHCFSSARGRDLVNILSSASEKKICCGHLAFEDEYEPTATGRLKRADKAEQGAGKLVLPGAGQL